MTGATIVLALVTLQRIAELALAQRNTKRLLARGAVEIAPGHYPAIVAVHAAWLATLWWLGHAAPVQPLWLAVYLVVQPLRIWVLATLGERWTTRIIVLPGAPLVRAGPYRVLDHPNYVVVMVEIAALPLAFGLIWPAALFSALNAAVLAVRIRAENRALRGAAAVRPERAAVPAPDGRH